jgi:hypothetical protein
MRPGYTEAANRTSAVTEPVAPPKGPAWPAWIPLLALPAATMAFRSRFQSWSFMWVLAFAIFFGCKWQTWWEQRNITRGDFSRTAGYLFVWPGMDAETFLDAGKHALRPELKEWFWASFKTVSGGALLWVAVRRVPEGNGLLAGWVGMLGMILILDFGSFHIVSLAWRSAGVEAQPIMQRPLSATSLSDFWSRRWNLGFRHLTHRLIFKPARVRFGAMPALLLSFLASGLIHELVISVPARGGYGLPTSYFMLQGVGIVFERSPLGKKLGLSTGICGWSFALMCAAAPALILFHTLFVRGVILPFLGMIGAR